MSKYIPNEKPKLTKEEALKILKHYYGDNLQPLHLIGIRGYYTKSMGNPNTNDINLYDDAMILYSNDIYETFNANTDPSFIVKNGRELAVLKTGKYKFYCGKHKNKYNALRAYPEGVVLPCTRNGKDSTCRFINIHKGGMTPSSAGVTWSEGCPSIPSNQWRDFIETVYRIMRYKGLKTVDFLLIDNDEMLKIIQN